MNIIITGNIGCGKSTIVAELAQHFPSYTVHSVDSFVHDLYSNSTFCEFLLDTFGTTERAQVSDIVFKDAAKKEALEKFSIAMLNADIERVLETRSAILEWPLYFEMSGHLRYGASSKSVAITCSDNTQMARVKKRDNFTDEKIAAIRASQFSTELKVAMSDYHVENNGGPITYRVKLLATELKIALLAGRAHKFFKNPHAWVGIQTRYSEPHRHYHTLEHLVSMFDLFDEHKDKIPHPWSVELAIWYHDYIYDVGDEYYKNEENSVRHMMQTFSGSIGEWPVNDQDSKTWTNTRAENYEKLVLAAEFILSTKGHAVKAPSVLACADKRLSNEYFLDIDLSILGSDAHTCRTYDNNIRKEFKDVSDDWYYPARAQAMHDFSKRPRIFNTNVFYKKYEKMARANMKTNILIWS